MKGRCFRSQGGDGEASFAASRLRARWSPFTCLQGSECSWEWSPLTKLGGSPEHYRIQKVFAGSRASSSHTVPSLVEFSALQYSKVRRSM